MVAVLVRDEPTVHLGRAVVANVGRGLEHASVGAVDVLSSRRTRVDVGVEHLRHASAANALPQLVVDTRHAVLRAFQRHQVRGRVEGAVELEKDRAVLHHNGDRVERRATTSNDFGNTTDGEDLGLADGDELVGVGDGHELAGCSAAVHDADGSHVDVPTNRA